MHDGNALADVVGAVAVDGGTGTIGVGDGLDNLQLAREVVELGLHIGEAVDAGDDLGGVLAQAVEDDAHKPFYYSFLQRSHRRLFICTIVFHWIFF